VSKHDDHFFNMFSVVIGILVAITIALFVLAKVVGGGMSAERAAVDPLLQAGVAERIRPFGQVAIAGQDNAALAIDHPSNLLAAALRANMADQRDAEFIALQHPETRGGVQQLEAAGLLAAGRAAVILDTPPTAEEIWNG
jgi:hypothetical protein